MSPTTCPPFGRCGSPTTVPGVDRQKTPITTPGVVAAAGRLHKAKATRPALDGDVARVRAHLATLDDAHPDHGIAIDALDGASDECRRNTDAQIRAAARLVEEAKLELLEAVCDAAATRGWSLRELADAAGVSRGTIANVLEASGMRTTAARSTPRT